MDHSETGREKEIKKKLAVKIAELKSDLSDKDLLEITNCVSSLGRIKTPDEYAMDRDVTFKKLLKPHQLSSFPPQYQSMLKEVNTSSRPIYTLENLPILLHQFYSDRINELIQRKHLYLVRWDRFSEGQSKVTEEMHAEFKENTENILHEYNDTLNRARRLSRSVDAVSAGKALPTNIIEIDDVIIYLRWLVFHQATTKRAAAFIQSLQWFPMLYHCEFSRELSALRLTGDAGTASNKTDDHTHSKIPPPTKQFRLSSVFSKQGPHILGRSHHKPSSSNQERGRGVSLKYPNHVTKHPDHVNFKEKTSVELEDGLPVISTNISGLQAPLRQLMANFSIPGVHTFPNQSDELHFYHLVNHKFVSVFQIQEQSQILHTYDKPPDEDNGTKRRHIAKLTFRKPSKWVQFVRIRPRPDPVQIQTWVQMRQRVTEVDPLLSLSSHCTHLHSIQRVMFALRQHYISVKSTTSPHSVQSHVTSADTMLVWKCIYAGLDIRDPLNSEEISSDQSFQEMGGPDIPPANDSFAVQAAITLISDPHGRRVSVEAHDTCADDAYLAFLMLRHIELREQRMKCLNVLNYFRSVERSLTINEEGLTCDSAGNQKQSRDTSLLDHHHLFNTPTDYLIDQSEFMMYMSVENYDDFYSYDTAGSVRVWDRHGVGVVYDSALSDVEKLEQELLTVGSYYMAHGFTRESTNAHGDPSTHAETLDIKTYSLVYVDRFTVLQDLWSAEANFLQAKMRVVNCYLECYHHTCARSDRANLAGIITTLLWLRPRYDLKANYFLETYDKECLCLKLQFQLVQEITGQQLSNERALNEQLFASGELFVDSSSSPKATPSLANFGLPAKLVPKHSVSLSGDKHVLLHSYLLEFASSLSVITSLPEAIEWSLYETVQNQSATSVAETLTIHCQLLKLALKEWKDKVDIGNSFSSDIQKNLFVDVCAEDHNCLTDLCVAHADRTVRKAESRGDSPTAQQQRRTQAWIDILNLVVTRYHMIITCSNTELLTRLYKQQMDSLNSDASHAHLRCVAFEHFVTSADQDLDHFVTMAEEDVHTDRYIPFGLHFAINELEEKHVGVFSFRSNDGLEKILSAVNGLRSVQVTHTCQVAHCNSLLVACQYNHLIIKHSIPHTSSSSAPKDSATKLASTHTEQNVYNKLSAATNTHSELSVTLTEKLKKKFISIQKEKRPVRDYMLSQFTQQPSTITHNQSELESTKIKLLTRYSRNLIRVFSTHSLRTQIIHHFDGMHLLLGQFPAVLAAFFTQGPVQEDLLMDRTRSHTRGFNASTGRRQDLFIEQRLSVGAERDPRQYKARPPTLLDREGIKLMNLWYMAHFTEVMTLFASLSLSKQQQALERVLHLVSGLHVFLQFTCAYIRLDCTPERSCDSQEVGGGWGGVEHIGEQLTQLQAEISRLDNPSDPDEVARYLWIRCHTTFLAHDICVRYNLRRAFIYKDCLQAVSLLDNVAIPSIERLTFSHTSQLPTPLDMMPESHIQDLVPLQYSLSQHNPLTSITSDHTFLVGAYVYTSLALFGPLELNLVHGEILAMSLLLEDVLTRRTHNPSSTPQPPLVTPHNGYHGNQMGGVRCNLRRSSESQHVTPKSKSLSSHTSTRPLSCHTPSGTPTQTLSEPIIHHHVINLLSSFTTPLEGGKVLEEFLIVTSQLEILKLEWGVRILAVPSIGTRMDCIMLENFYRDNVYNWSRRKVAKQQSREVSRMQLEDSSTVVSSATFLTEPSQDNLASIEDFESSANFNELTFRQTQVARLKELLDVIMIQETIQHVGKLHNLAFMEGQRDTTSLPIDLWKTGLVSTEYITGLPRPHVVEDFIRDIRSKLSEEGDETVSLRKTDLRVCLQQLASGVLARERDCYHLYASYYEAILRSQYNQLYMKNQDVDHYCSLAESNAVQTRHESLTFLADHTHSLILEITALRNKVSELKQTLAKASLDAQAQAQDNYTQLVNNLFSASLAIKAHYEKYRGHLYGDVTSIVHEVRQSVTNRVADMKETIGLGASATIATPTQSNCLPTRGVAMETSFNAAGIKDIQMENAELSKMLIKMRAIHAWNSYKTSVAHRQKVSSLKLQLNDAHLTCLHQKILAEQEIISLEQQVQAIQTSLGQVETQCEMLTQSLKDKKQRKASSIRPSTRMSSHFAHERLSVANYKHVKQELEEKEKLLKAATTDNELARRQSVVAMSRNSKTTRELKNKLRHERNMKQDAFNHVDELLTQVEDFTLQQAASLKISRPTSSRVSQLITSTPHTPPPSARSSCLSSASHSRVARPKTVAWANRRGSEGETIDLSREILALKLI